MAKKAHRIGRYSHGNALVRLDFRTREGKFARAIQDELVAHIGGQPSAPERILIQVAVTKILRIALMADYVLSQESISERDDRQFLCWSNSLRRDLDVLGLTRRAKSSPRLAELLGHRAA